MLRYIFFLQYDGTFETFENHVAARAEVKKIELFSSDANVMNIVNIEIEY